MKVLQLSSETGWRGGERQVAYLVTELAARNVKTIVAGRSGSALGQYCIAERIHFIPLGLRNSLDVASAFAITKICKEHGVDLIHAQTAIAHSIAVISAQMGNTVPVVLSRRVAFPPKSDWFTRWKYNHPAIKRIICVSDKTRQIVSNYVRQKDKLVTVYSGVDLKKFKKPEGDLLKEQYEIPDHVFRIGNAAALEEEKDHFTFIRTIGRLKAKGFAVHGIVAGKGPQEAQLKAFAISLGLDKNITFTGYIKDIQRIMFYLDVFMMTSSQEGLGTAILDAFAAGAVVVATATGGIPELVIDGETGLLAPVGDDETLARHLETLILNPDKKLAFRAAGARHVTLFSKEITAEKTLDIYREVLEESPTANSGKPH